MPLYYLNCSKCEHEMESFVKLDEKLPKCPKCGQSMTKLISPTSFILNGRNWEKDGYGLRIKKEGGKK
jgi:putative FmdB family regulatory protein